MEILGASVGNRTDRAGPLLVFRVEVRHADFELGDHFRIRIDGSGAVAAGVGNVGAVGGDVERVSRQAILEIGAVEGALIGAVADAVGPDSRADVTGRLRSSRR